MSIDLSGYLDVFADEAREHLQALNEALLEFEKDTNDLEHVNVMFRSAHTLKGMSATMGFSEIAELTHKMENLLTPIRQGELKANEDIVDALFQCLDMLQDMVEAHINQEDHGIDVSELVTKLKTLTEGGGVAQAAAPADAPQGDTPAASGGYPGKLGDEDDAAILTARNNGKEILHARVNLAEGCELKNVRAFMVLKLAREIGDLLHASPDEKTLTEGEIDGGFDLLVATSDGSEDLEQGILDILEIESTTIIPFGDAGDADIGASRGVSDVFEINEYDLAVIKQAVSEGFRLMHVHVILADDCTLKSARAFMVHKKLEEAGEIINIVPETEDIEFERFDRDLDFLVLTKAASGSTREQLDTISEIETIEINENALVPEHPTTPAVKKEAPGKTAAEEKAEPGKALKKAPAKDIKKTAAAPKAVKQTHTIRVDTERLDMLLNLVGELVIGKTRLQQLATEIRRPELTDTIEQFDQIVFDLQNVVMQTRMMPIETVFNRFPRMIRDLAKQRGKQIELVETGGETELDRTVIDEIGDPLVHLIRNSVDHGIETPEERVAKGKPEKGTLTLAAYHEGSNVFIEIRDDGKGIDPAVIRRKCVEKEILSQEQAAALSDQQAIEMIFAAGMSTAEKVSDISGRGVGMDVVTSKIKELNGDVKLTSTIDAGTTITIKLPLTLAIVQALLVDIAGETFATPLAYIEQTLRINTSEIQKVNRQDVYTLRGEVLPLIWMHELMHSPEHTHDDDSWFVVVVHSGKQRVGLCVDNPIGQTEIVIKSLGAYLQDIKYIAGGTILGDGTVALILDVARIAE